MKFIEAVASLSIKHLETSFKHDEDIKGHTTGIYKNTEFEGMLLQTSAKKKPHVLCDIKHCKWTNKQYLRRQIAKIVKYYEDNWNEVLENPEFAEIWIEQHVKHEKH